MAIRPKMTGKELNELRKALGWSITDCALELGIERPEYIREMEAGKRAVTGPISKLMKLYEREYLS